MFRNPQSILCGVIAGLLFIPTTIFDMVWGVRFLQEARGFDYGTAVMRSAAVPLGWIIGCPLLGCDLRSHRPPQAGDPRRRRGPAAPAWPGSSTGRPTCCRRTCSALVAGIASGAAMLPYTVIKEANPPQMSGTATGVINFINFTFSALLGPVFGAFLRNVSGGVTPMSLEHYQAAFSPLLYGVALAVVLTFLLRNGAAQTGHCEDDMTRPDGKVRRTSWSAAPSCEPIPTAVAHPCEALGAGRRHRSRREETDHADPRRAGRQDPARSPQRPASTSGGADRRCRAQPCVRGEGRGTGAIAAKRSC